MKHFTDIKIGDTVKIYDAHEREYTTYRIKTERAETSAKFIEPNLNPNGVIYYGKNLDKPNGTIAVTEHNFIDIIKEGE